MAETIALFNNKLIKVDNNKIGLHPSCCCGETPPGCECPQDCVPGLSISLGEGGNPSCTGGFYFDEIPCNDGQISVSMGCVDGIWNIGVQIFCFNDDGFCFEQYGANLQCENDNLPPAGNVNLFLIESNNNPGCDPPPVVTIIKP